ncbi:MAG TPA: hybrid sensor histidine kinase/response regulator [Candidatus Binataceae bacterium]|nr:hybrid sensor histidine kinase/response regulator [Candidatus Binataceae bacterium]
MDEVVSEFLIESHENLNQLDHDLVELEKDPRSTDLLASVFRTFHTMKGVSGFLNFARLERLAHAAEDMLSKLRDGALTLNEQITSALLASVDAVRQMLAAVEQSGTDGDGDYSALIERLHKLTSGEQVAAPENPASADVQNAATPPAPLVEAAAPAPKDPVARPRRKKKEAAPVVAAEPEPPVVEAAPLAAPVSVPEEKPEEVKPAPAQVEPALTKSAPLDPEPPAPAHIPVEVAAPKPAPARPAAVVPQPGAHPGAPREEHHESNNANAAAATTAASAAHAADSVIRVNVNLLDKLMNLVGELVLVRNQILQFSTGQQESAFLGTSQRLNLITTELQEGIMKTRMQPIGNIWSKFPRIVRDLALACNKQVRIEMEGEETELDKTLIEAIRDPLTHIVRNAIDHGVESSADRAAMGKPAEGRLFLRALHQSGQVIIEVGDDGAGIDFERVRNKALERGLISADQASRMTESESLKLIFLPGFSTADKVTNISGRGVGMDVVRTNIEKIGGTVDIHSRHGEGTTLRIKIPLTLAIIPALIVTCAEDRYAIPQISLIELVRLDSGDKDRRIETVHGASVYRLRGNLLPLVYLREVLKLPLCEQANESDASHIVVLQIADQLFGLVVDEVNDTEEIVVKPLGKHLKGMSAFAGATIMGDGRVALILDVLGIAQLATVAVESRESSRSDEQRAVARANDKRQALLLCRAGSAERIAVPLALVSRLEEFDRKEIEHAAGCNVVRYRERILPLVELSSLIDAGPSRCDESREQVQVVVFDDGLHRVGVVVDQIVDIVEEEAIATQLSGRPGLLGSALVAQKTTDFLDLRAVFEAARGSWYEAESAAELTHGSILLVDQSAFSRVLVRSYLEMAGHQVFEASGAAEAIEKLDHNQIDVAIVSANLPGNGPVFAQIRKRTSETHIPILGLADERGEKSAEAAQKYDAYHAKADRQAIIDAVAELIARRTQAPANSEQAEVQA